MWITAVTLDGLALELDGILADVTIRHGRATIDDGPTASTIQLRLRNMTRPFTGDFRVGVPLTVDADGVRRFTGLVTDASLDDDVLTAIGVGVLATLSRYPIGAAPWPAEQWSARVQRAFAEAGLTDLLVLQYDDDFDPVLIARGTVEEPPEPVSLYAYLQTLATDVGAAIADTPDGKVLVQALNARLKLSTLTWATAPAGVAWNEVDPGLAWEDADAQEDLDPAAGRPHVVVDPADVLYVPVWEMVDEVENLSEVGYGDDLSVTAAEPASVALYGERPGGITTQLAGLADATQRASERVTRRAFPRWVIRSVPLLRGYPSLTVGQVVDLTGFPPASPYEDWSPVLEGWTDTIDGDLWLCELAVTDPLLSGVALLWTTTPADLAWNEVDPGCSWAEATALGALTTTERMQANA